MPIKNKHFQNDYYSSSEWSAACICLFKCSAISTCGKASASPTPSHCARYTPHKLCKSSMVNVQFFVPLLELWVGLCSQTSPTSVHGSGLQPLARAPQSWLGFLCRTEGLSSCNGEQSDLDLRLFLQSLCSPSQPSLTFGIMMKIRLLYCHINFKHMAVSTTETLLKMHKRQETIDCFWSWGTIDF